MVVIIDNYDSFTYNLVQAVGGLSYDPIRVVRNDEVGVSEVAAMRPRRLMISPGPCTPREAGVSVDVVRLLAGSVPILGVCLGHQCIAAAFGARIVRMRYPMHGKTDDISHDGMGIYRGLPEPLTVMRYHSLVVDEASLPRDLMVTARSSRGEVMGIRHRRYALEGVQFHPESYATRFGVEMIASFLKKDFKSDKSGDTREVLLERIGE